MSTSRRSFTPCLSVAIDSPNRSLKHEYRIHTMLVQVGIVVLAWKHQRMMKILNAWHLQQETHRTPTHSCEQRPCEDCCIARLVQHLELGASKLRVEWSSLRTYVVLFIPNNIRHDIPVILKNIFVSQDVFCFTLSFNYQSNPFDIICPHFNKHALLALYMYDMLHMCCILRFRL